MENIFEFQGCTNIWRQFMQVNKFCTMGSNVFWVLCRGLALLTAKMLRYIFDFLEKIVLPHGKESTNSTCHCKDRGVFVIPCPAPELSLVFENYSPDLRFSQRFGIHALSIGKYLSTFRERLVVLY
jgi:hypothetical protein